MQTLNVGAGRTDAEYQSDQEQQRADLRAEARSDANFFFYAAGLALLGSGLLPVKLNVLVNIGAIDLYAFYGRSNSPFFPFLVLGFSATWLGILVGLGFVARQGYRWAFLAGIFLYAIDMIALIVTFSIWAFGVHSVFLFKWFQGQRALRDLKEAERQASKPDNSAA